MELGKVVGHEPFVTQRRTLGEGDFSMLTNVSWTTGELHSYVGDSGEDQRWLALPCVAAVIVGLCAKHFTGWYLPNVLGIRVAESRELTIIGHHQVQPGDTLQCEVRIVEADSQTSIVRAEERCHNQRGDLVAVVTQIWRVRPAG